MHPLRNVTSHLVNEVIEVVDVDGVVRRIDVNDVVERIDINHLVSRIDMNQLLSKIDWNQQLSRIDFDTLLNHIDTNAILARSSTGFFTTFLDTARTQLVLTDLWLMWIVKCQVWTRRRCHLSPKPGERRHDTTTTREIPPKGRTNKAVAVQGRYCGFVSKLVAILVDIVTITLLFALIFQLVEWCLMAFLGKTRSDAEDATSDFQTNAKYGVMIIYASLWFMYFFLTVGLAGQTLGMLLVGLKVCQSQRYATVTLQQAFVRTCLLPVSLTLFPPLGVIGVFRRDGRMLHDLIAGTGMIYLWDASLAKLRHKAMRMERSDSVMSQEDDADELDEMMEGADHDSDEDSDVSNNDEGRREVLLGRENDVLATTTNSSTRGNYTTFCC